MAGLQYESFAKSQCRHGKNVFQLHRVSIRVFAYTHTSFRLVFANHYQPSDSLQNLHMIGFLMRDYRSFAHCIYLFAET